MYEAGKVNRLDFYKVKWHLKMYVVVLKVKAILVRNLSSVKHKMQIVSREDAVSIQGLPGPLVAVSALCSRLDQVSRSLLSYEVSEMMGLALFTVKLHIKTRPPLTPLHVISLFYVGTLASLRSLHGPGRPQQHTATPQYPPIKVGGAHPGQVLHFTHRRRRNLRRR